MHKAISTNLGADGPKSSPVCPAVKVPVAFRSLNGNCVKSPAISPPLEYHEQKAACIYLFPIIQTVSN